MDEVVERFIKQLRPDIDGIMLDRGKSLSVPEIAEVLAWYEEYKKHYDHPKNENGL